MIRTDRYKELAEVIWSKDELLTSIPDEYFELGGRMENTSGIEHVDMWHEQVNFLDEEHPFSSPAAFIEFNMLGIRDEGLLIQRLHAQINFRLSCGTFSGIYEGAAIQEETLSFLDLLALLGMMLHGESGKNFGTLRRTHVGREESGGVGNLYRISFECEIVDYTTMELASRTDMKDCEMKVGNGDLPERTEDGESLYHL